MGQFLTPTQEFFKIDDDEEYQLVTVKLHGKGIIPRSRLKGSQIKTKEQQRIRTNQFLIAEIDAKFGAFGIVPVELDGAIVSGHYFLYDIDSQKISPQFLECYISSGILTQRVQKYIQGALNYSAIRPHHVLEVPFPLPEGDAAAAQEDIIKKFTHIKRIQVQAEKQLQAAYALERALMRQYFDFKEC